ncbi:cytoplasmic protein [Brucella abortus str. 2308 A]|nr:cytoplasmic protein [Brucella abortus str. 2308 A]
MTIILASYFTGQRIGQGGAYVRLLYSFIKRTTRNKYRQERPMLRQEISQALTTALKAQEKRRMSTLRLVMAAVKDRDIANRTAGKDPVGDEELLGILGKMVKQREESARIYEEGSRLELAEAEREEIAIISEFLPQQMTEDETKKACEDVITEIGAQGLRDMGKCMALLKERYAGKMDFTRASALVKSLLQ